MSRHGDLYCDNYGHHCPALIIQRTMYIRTSYMRIGPNTFIQLILYLATTTEASKTSRFARREIHFFEKSARRKMLGASFGRIAHVKLCRMEIVTELCSVAVFHKTSPLTQLRCTNARYFLKAVIKRTAAARIYPRHFYHLYKYIRRTPQTLLEYFELRDRYKLHAGKLPEK